MEKTKVQFLKAYKDLFDESYRYFAYYGGRNSGKSHQVALALLLRGRQKKLRILCTREVQNTIRDSVHKLLSDIIDKHEWHDYLVTRDAIVNQLTGTEFLFKGLRMNINEIKSTEGIDIAWCEEAQSMSKHSIEVLTPTIRKKGSQIIFTFNRFTDLDPVFVKYVLNKPENTLSKLVNYDVLEEVGLLSDAIKSEIEEDKKIPSLYAHKWLGEPISQDEFSIINRDDIMKAMNANIDSEGSVEVGVDVARMGSDRTVFSMVHGLKTLKYEVHEKKRTTEICDLLEKFINFNKDILLKIDDTGVGGGVTDEMIKRGYKVVAINFGAEPEDKDKYPNLISEAWFKMSEVISQSELPMSQDLLMELSTRKWKQDIKGRRVVESKKEYKARGYRSPDLADSFIIAYYRYHRYDPKQDSNRISW
jgi:phage terminase large subunit